MDEVKIKVHGALASVVMQYVLWIHGLVSAALGGASAAVGGVVGAQVAGVNIFTRDFWVIVASTAAGGALMTVIAYFKESPLPRIKIED